MLNSVTHETESNKWWIANPRARLSYWHEGAAGGWILCLCNSVRFQLVAEGIYHNASYDLVIANIFCEALLEIDGSRHIPQWQLQII